MATINVSSNHIGNPTYGLYVDDVLITQAGSVSGTLFQFKTYAGYVFTEVSVWDWLTESNWYAPLSENGTVATFPANKYSAQMSVQTKADPNTQSMVVSQTALDIWDGNSFDLYVDDEKIESPGTYVGSEFKFVARPPFFFVTLEGAYDHVTETRGQVDSFSEDMTVAYFTPSVLNWSDSNYVIVMDQEEVPVTVLGANEVFIIGDEEVGEVIKRAFSYGIGGDDTYAKYILGLLRLPFSVDEDFIIGSQEIKLNEKATGVFGDKLSVDKLSFNLGQIEVTGQHGDFRDYKNVDCILHLPFTEPVAIDTKYVVNQTLSLELQVNLYNGEAMYLVRSTFADDGVASVQRVALEVNVPFARLQDVPRGSDPRDIKFGVDNGLWQAYVELQEPETEDGMFVTPVPDEGKLGDFSGFVRVQEMAVQIQATSREEEALNELLKKGIFV